MGINADQLKEELNVLNQEERFLEDLMEKLANDKVKLKREEMAIRAAIIKREREKNNPDSNILPQ